MKWSIEKRKPIAVTICLCIASLLLGAMIGQAAIPSSTFTISSGIYPGAPSYTIWREGSTYYAKSAYGAIDFSGTNFITVLSNVESVVDDTGGTIYLKNLAFGNAITLSPTVTLIEDLYGKITHYPRRVHFEKLTIANNDEFSTQMTIYPKAIYYASLYRKTYLVYLNTIPASWSIYIRAFNHDTETWGSAYLITDNMGTDAHLAPSIGILPNGKIIVFYRKGTLQSVPLYYRISTSAEVESAFEAEQSFSTPPGGDDRFSYSQPCSFSNKLVLFALTKMSDTQFRWWKTTTTNGTTWTNWIETANFGDDAVPYFIFNKVGSQILAAGHKAILSTLMNEDLYFAYSDDQGDTWKEEDGSAVTLPIDEDQKILDTLTGEESYGTCYPFALLDEHARPVIVASYLPGAAYGHSMYIAQYMAPLGTVSTWKLAFAQDPDGTDLDFCWWSYQYPALVEGAIEFVQAINGENKTSIFRRVAGTNFRFDQKFIDGTSLNMNHQDKAIMSEPVRDRELASNPIDWITSEVFIIYARSYNRRNYP